MRFHALFSRLAIVAAAVLIVCALQALSGAAPGDDTGFVSGEPGAAPAPASENTMTSRAERRRLRRLKRVGGGAENVDAGAPRDAGPMRFAVRDAGTRLPVVAPPPVAPPPPPVPTPPPTPGASATSLPTTDLGFNTCRKIPSGKRAVKVNLKPEVDLPELVAWISSITCKSFVLPGHLSAAGKKITIVTQGVMTPREAYATFLSALDSLGLTVEQGPGYLKIIETSKAKSSSVPVYGFDGQPTERKGRRAGQAESDD